MTEYATEVQEPHDLEDRTVRALTECMSALPEGGDIYTVVSESGSSYKVDSRQGRCSCPDSQHNLDDDESCKHERRVAFATGVHEVPDWVNTDAIDPQLGDHVEGPSVVTDTVTSTTQAITDGGTTLATSQEKDVESADTENDDCDCSKLPDGCPCWPCYREGKATFSD